MQSQVQGAKGLYLIPLLFIGVFGVLHTLTQSVSSATPFKSKVCLLKAHCFFNSSTHLAERQI